MSTAPTLVYVWDLDQAIVPHLSGGSRALDPNTWFGSYVYESTGTISLATASWLAGNQYYRLKFWLKGEGTVNAAPVNTTSWHPYTVLFRAGGAVSVAATSATIAIANIRLENASAAEFAAASDVAVYDLGMDVPDRDDPSRLALLPNTMDRLINGSSGLHIVFLGDSLMADTYGSQWQALLERAFPVAQITSHLSSIGTTGVPFYRLPGNMQTYVFDYNPNLLYIGRC